MSYFGNSDYTLEVRRGNVAGTSMLNLQGEAPAMGTTFQPIWGNAGGISTALVDSSRTDLFIASTSASDALAGPGVGAQTTTVIGLDGDGAAQTFTADMAGQTAVALTGTWTAINGITVASVGSTGWNVGDLWVGYGGFTAGIPASKLFYAPATYNLGKTLAYTVPAGKELYLKQFALMMGDTSKFADFRVFTYDGTMRRAIAPLELGAGDFITDPDGAPALAAGTMLWVEGKISATTSDVVVLIVAYLDDV